MTGHETPRFVSAILDWPPTWFVVRLALLSAYLIGGVTKLGNWPSAVAEQVHFGVHPPELTAALTWRKGRRAHPTDRQDDGRGLAGRRGHRCDARRQL